VLMGQVGEAAVSGQSSVFKGGESCEHGGCGSVVGSVR
jgi:hypothetical protein